MSIFQCVPTMALDLGLIQDEKKEMEENHKENCRIVEL